MNLLKVTSPWCKVWGAGNMFDRYMKNLWKIFMFKCNRGEDVNEEQKKKKKEKARCMFNAISY